MLNSNYKRTSEFLRMSPRKFIFKFFVFVLCILSVYILLFSFATVGKLWKFPVLYPAREDYEGFQFIVKSWLNDIELKFGASFNAAVSRTNVINIIANYTKHLNKSNIYYPMTLNNSPYNIMNPEICSRGSAPDILILIHSATAHFDRRNSIRKTWANASLFHRVTIRRVFVLGLPNFHVNQSEIEAENAEFGDILQGNFIDTYRNLTHKAVLGLRWVSEFCPNASKIIKADDDVFVNIFCIVDKILIIFRSDERMVRCYLMKVGTSLICRNKEDWAVTDDVFPGQRRWPIPHCTGFFVLYTPDQVRELYEAARTTPFLWLDDVYVFGLLTKVAGNVSFKKLEIGYIDEKKAKKCFTQTTKCGYLTSFITTKSVMEMLWSSLIKQYSDLVKKYSY